MSPQRNFTASPYAKAVLHELGRTKNSIQMQELLSSRRHPVDALDYGSNQLGIARVDNLIHKLKHTVQIIKSDILKEKWESVKSYTENQSYHGGDDAVEKKKEK